MLGRNGGDTHSKLLWSQHAITALMSVICQCDVCVWTASSFTGALTTSWRGRTARKHCWSKVNNCWGSRRVTSPWGRALEVRHTNAHTHSGGSTDKGCLHLLTHNGCLILSHIIFQRKSARATVWWWALGHPDGCVNPKISSSDPDCVIVWLHKCVCELMWARSRTGELTQMWLWVCLCSMMSAPEWVGIVWVGGIRVN